MGNPIESVLRTFPEHDRVIKLIVKDGDGKEPPTSHALLYKVNLQKLSDASAFFRTLLSSDKFADTGKYVVEITDDISPLTLGTILEVCHEVEATDIKLENMTLERVWELAAKIDQYLLDISDFGPWFRLWYAKNQGLVERKGTSLLYLTWEFDHAEAFQHITKRLAYETSGHIKETAIFPQLHLPERVVGGLNAARGRLKTVLQKGLNSDMRTMLRQGCCPKQEKYLFSYLRMLNTSYCWPVDEALSGALDEDNCRRSINDILDRLQEFTLEPDPKPDDHVCATCPSDWTVCVARAIEQTEKYFDGLCIDCMENSESKTGHRFKGYWEEWSQHDTIDKNCRVRHGQSSWYHSWLGRPEDRLSNLRRRQQHQRIRDRSDRR